MAYLILVGLVAANSNGLGSKGYHAYRRGTRVRVIWGPIETLPKKRVTFAWAAKTCYQDYHHRTVDRAKARLAQILAARESEGYTRLPVGNRIARRAHTPLGSKKRAPKK